MPVAREGWSGADVTSPTARTLARLRKDGATAQVVERWNQYSKTRHDLFGWIDIVAMRNNTIVGIQATSGTNVSARLAKMRAEPRLELWLQAGGKAEIHGWRQLGKAGKRKLWKLRTVCVTEEGETEHE